MATLGVVMITLNEEHNVGRALESVKFADEIVVCDSQSTDRTVEIAREHGALIIMKQFTGFGAAKQAALERLTTDWVVVLDADEEVDAEARDAIRQTISQPQFDGYQIRRRSQFLGRWMKHSGWYPDWILRLFRRECGKFTEHKVHESVQVTGEIGRLAGHLLHYTDPDIDHYLHKLNRYTLLSAQELAAAGRRFSVLKLLFGPLAVFLKRYILKLGFLDGLQGFLLAIFSGYHVFCKYAKLWELRRK
ncbi:MAG: glycosyltransferase family 2 protein [bacterium]